MTLRKFAFPLALALSALTLPATAAAQEEVCQPMAQADLDEFVAAVQQKVADFQFDEAGYNLDDIQKRMGCLETVVKPSTIAQIARIRSLIAFFAQDEDKALRWGFAQKHASPGDPWPSGLERIPAYDEIWEWADDPTVGSGGAGVAHPKKGGVFMNGHFLEKPEYMAEVPGFVQIADKKGNVIDAYWQDGAAFRPDVIADEASSATSPKWFVPEALPEGPAVAEAPEPEPEVTKPEPEPEVTKPEPEPEVTKPEPEPETAEGTGDTETPEVTKPEPTEEPETTEGTGDTETTEDPETAEGTGDTETPEVTKPELVEGASGFFDPPDPVEEPEPEPEEVGHGAGKPEKSGPNIVLLGASGGAAILAGTAYLLSTTSHAGVRKAAEDGTLESEKQLGGRRTFINTMAIGSGVLAAGAIGVGVTAFINTNGGPNGLRLSARW
ncbi:MAG: hypothetical protein KC912_04855 [Proteobacteria bacterium]|nr:hypothetical protein [Pseudomonadota bacterium]